MIPLLLTSSIDTRGMKGAMFAAEERERMYATLEDIERWLITCEDPEIVSIIRWHYLLGLDWRQTNKKVYGYPDYWRSRKKIVRFFEKK